MVKCRVFVRVVVWHMAAPCSHFGGEARKRERVRCSSLFDWPVYPRLAHTMRASNDAQCGAKACVRSPRSVARRAEIARAVEKVIEVTPQGWADRGAGRAARPLQLWAKGNGRRRRVGERGRSERALTPHGQCAKIPSIRSGARRYEGWHPTRACFFKPKTCQYPPFVMPPPSDNVIELRRTEA